MEEKSDIFENGCNSPKYRKYALKKRVLSWMKGEKAPPYQCNLYFTKKCNLGCKFCYYSDIDKNVDYSAQIDKETLIKLAQEGSALGIEFWYVGGGEPLMAADSILSMMEVIKKNGGFGNINTNGTLITEEIATKLVEMEWDEVTVSINSADPKIDDDIRGRPDVLKRCIKGIETLQKVKEELQTGRNITVNMVSEKIIQIEGSPYKELTLVNKGKLVRPAPVPVVKVHTVISNKNYIDLKEIVMLSEKLGAMSVTFTHIMDDTSYAKSLKLSPEQTELFKLEVKRTLEYAESHEIYTNLREYLDSEVSKNVGNYYDTLKDTAVKHDKKDISSAICFEPWTQISIFADGTVGLCGVWNPSVSKENLHKKGIKEIWYGDFFEEIREKMIQQEKLDECGDCAISRIFKNEEIKEELKNFFDQK